MKVPREIRKALGPAPSTSKSPRVRSKRTPALTTSNTLFGAQLVAFCRAGGLPEPTPEHHFALPEREWRFDWSWVAEKVALEIEGLTPEGGRHQRMKGYAEDAKKYSTAAVMGWCVIRCTYGMLADGTVYGLLDEAFRLRGCARSAPREGAA